MMNLPKELIDIIGFICLVNKNFTEYVNLTTSCRCLWIHNEYVLNELNKIKKKYTYIIYRYNWLLQL